MNYLDFNEYILNKIPVPHVGWMNAFYICARKKKEFWKAMKTFEQGLGFLIDDYSHNSSVVEFFYIIPMRK